MQLSDLRIVFMGTPEFAVATLDALLQSGCQVVAVVTAPDKPAGRGLKMNESAVKKYAKEHGLYLLQPEKLRSPEFIEELIDLHAHLQIVVAFRMLPEVVWNMPPMGTVNLHASLLPKYRGAAPINWAIINGEIETGVTSFKLKHEIDSGNILLQEKMNIGENETAGELHDRMKECGARLIVRTVQELAAGGLREIAQSSLPSGNDPLPGAPKLNTDTCTINWNLPMQQVHNLIRGLSPYPGAFTKFNDKVLKIYRSAKEPGTPTEAPGTCLTDQKTFLKFSCPDGYIHVLELQLEGRKKMETADFLRGFRN